jgi:hypothetical protein
LTTNIDNASDLASKTWEALAASDIPEEAYDVAFGAVFAYLAEGTPAAATGSARVREHSPRGGTANEGAGVGTAAIANALGVSEDAVAYLFDIDGRSLDLTIRRDQLSKDRATALKEVALLVVAGRQATGLDTERTDSNHVRAQGVELGVMAKNTFREEMGNLGPLVTSRPLGRFNRALKMTKHGYDETAKLVERIAATAQSHE